MTDAAPAGDLYRLLTWFSPAYPLGAYSYSGGLEQAVEAGLVTTAAAAGRWIATALHHGTAGLDATVFAAAWRATAAADDAALDDVAALAAAWRAGAEAALESSAQGAAFLRATGDAWPAPALQRFAERHRGAAPLAVAAGVGCAAHGIPLATALVAFVHSLAGNLVSAAVRLVPLGQSDGQRVLAALAPAVAEAAAAAARRRLDELGTAALVQEWCGQAHETQYSRLFRS